MSDALQTTAPKNIIQYNMKVWLPFMKRNFLPLAGWGVVAGAAAFWLIQPKKVMMHIPIIGKDFK